MKKRRKKKREKPTERLIIACHLPRFSVWVCQRDSEERTVASGASRMRTSRRRQIAQLHNSATPVLLRTDWLVGWRYLKGIQTPRPVHQVLSSAWPPLRARALVCVPSAGRGPAANAADLRGEKRRREEEEGEWKSQLTERSLVCLLECLWEPLTVNLSSWRVRKWERNKGKDGEEESGRGDQAFPL